MAMQDQLGARLSDHLSEVFGVGKALMFGRIVGHRRMMQQNNSKQLCAGCHDQARCKSLELTAANSA